MHCRPRGRRAPASLMLLLLRELCQRLPLFLREHRLHFRALPLAPRSVSICTLYQ
jgi:hypothetical protein